MKKAIIFSKSESISRIVFSELSLLGYTPRIVCELPEESGVELIVFDATSLELSTPLRGFINRNHSSNRIAIINNAGGNLSVRFDKVLPFPFLISELRAAVLDAYSTAEKANAESTPREKCFVLSTDALGVSFENTYIPLSKYEAKLLKLLCENSGRCVTRKDILSLFGADDSNISDVYICHLRNKLETPFGIKVIYTVRGEGYMTDYIIK